MSSLLPLASSLCLLLLLSFLTGKQVVEGHGEDHSHRHHHHHHHHHTHLSNRHAYTFWPTKLFVFGDSYADTGNNRKSESSWKIPYGITFPGKPAGRFSDGRVLTDFIAKSFGLKSPVQYQWRKLIGTKYLEHGMNFAYGGSGVFDTLAPYPNMTAQIDLFEQLLKDDTFCAANVNSSLTVVTLSGNDYSAYKAKNGNVVSLRAFINTVIRQLGANLRRLYELGTRKVVVAALQPLGCLPSSTVATSFQKCNEEVNLLVGLHNQLLHQAVAYLNTQTASSTFVVADIYSSFLSVLNNGTGHGQSKFENPLKPCCVGVSKDFNCGSIERNGTKMYTVCEDPKSSFFWDSAHPTEAGWRAVYSSLSSTLRQL
ncbi:GDSL esterase/lipase At5g03610-like [Punica granatum]|uniref:Uncharacterized protein n=2 Tax=Punica granatum TaxID=22663 RepID=A0A218X2Y7_PUNGR|nr:GDSL esterase/lipase At5g03610-like [Punica granatum]OWM79099.1 hypothetical protein CDL15_Pgr003270 [Punica granatum]PKI49318.1 hypothetical protein CRG98_030246 [Punica granatum]